MVIEPTELAGIIESHGANASLISVLEDIQARYRYLPRSAMALVSQSLGVPLSQAFSPTTHYSAFARAPLCAALAVYSPPLDPGSRAPVCHLPLRCQSP
jgi:hypothetical protein